MPDYDALATSLGGLDLKGMVKQQSEASGLPADFVLRLVQQESGFNPGAVSPKGARGLMQLMPETAAQLGVTDPMDPAQSLRGGLQHLKRLSDKYHGDQRLIAAAYNAGEGAVDHAGGVPNFPETQHYVQVVANPDPDQVAKDLGGVDYDGLAKQSGGAEQKTSSGDTKKNENLNKYAKANPSVWQRVVARASNPVGTLGDLAIGAGKQALQTVDTLADAARKYVPGVASLDKVMTPVQVNTTPSNTVQKIGGGLEQAAEFAVPAGKLAAGTTLLTKGAPMIAKMGAQALGQGALGYGMAKAHGDNPVVGATLGAAGGAATPVIDAVQPFLAKSATSLMRSALKPTRTLLRDVPVGARGVPLNERAAKLANYVLENKLTPKTAQALVQQLGDQLTAARAGAGQAPVEAAQQVEAALRAINDKFKGDIPLSKDIQRIVDNLYEMKPGPAVTREITSPILDASGKPVTHLVSEPGPAVRVPRKDISADEALTLAQTMKPMNRAKFGEPQNPSIEAGKSVESALRTSAKDVDEIAAAQKPYPMALVTAKALDHAANRIANREAVNPFTWITHALAPLTLGGSELVAAAQQYMHKHPMEAAQHVYGLAQALQKHNLPLVAQYLMRLGQGGATDMTRGAGAPKPPVPGEQK